MTGVLAPLGDHGFRVPVESMNINRLIPVSSDTFTVAYDEASLLARFVRYADENNISSYVKQAAVWIITNNASDSALLSADLIFDIIDRTESFYTYRGSISRINQENIDEARRILAEIE